MYICLIIQFGMIISRIIIKYLYTYVCVSNVTFLHFNCDILLGCFLFLPNTTFAIVSRYTKYAKCTESNSIVYCCI